MNQETIKEYRGPMDTVLIVEDDRIQSSLLSRILEKYRDKFSVITAADGQEAIDVLKKQPISLVVTDIQMPRVNGLALLAHIDTHHPNIPCFVMTAYGTSRLKAKLPDDLIRFFQKPFNIDELAEEIMAVLDRDVDDETQEGISLISFLYMIEMEQTSCLLEIESPGNPPGVMHIEEGVLHDAECGDLTGEAAALELISRKNATPRFKFTSLKQIPRIIRTDLKELIRIATGGDDAGD